MKFFLTYYFFSKEDEEFPEPITGSPEGVKGLLPFILGALYPILYIFNISSVAVFLATLNHLRHPFI